MKFKMKVVKVPVKNEQPWQKLEKQLQHLKAGQGVKISGLTSAKMGSLTAAMRKFSKFDIAVSRESGGYLVIVSGLKEKPAEKKPEPAAPAAAKPFVPPPPAPEPEPEPEPEPQPEDDDADESKSDKAGRKPIYTVSHLGPYYIEELSAIANELGIVRVPKHLIVKRGKRALSYALTELRRAGHNIDGRKQRKSKSLLIPRAGGARVIVRPDRVGVLFGAAFNKLDALTRPDNGTAKPEPPQAASHPPAQPSQPPAPIVPPVHRTVHAAPVKVPPQPEPQHTKVSLTEPKKFPTGNKCFVCVGSGESVCGETSVTTYKGVRICRVHMKLLQQGAALYARPKITRGPMLLKK